MKNSFYYLFSRYKKVALLILTFLFLVQTVETYLYYFVTTKDESRHLLGIAGVALLVIVLFLFPFLAFRNELSRESSRAQFSPWLFGFIISLPFISLEFAFGLVNLGIKIFWLHDMYWVSHWHFYLVALVLGSIFYMFLGGLASWLASFCFAV